MVFHRSALFHRDRMKILPWLYKIFPLSKTTSKHYLYLPLSPPLVLTLSIPHNYKLHIRFVKQFSSLAPQECTCVWHLTLDIRIVTHTSTLSYLHVHTRKPRCRCMSPLHVYTSLSRIHVWATFYQRPLLKKNLLTVVLPRWLPEMTIYVTIFYLHERTKLFLHWRARKIKRSFVLTLCGWARWDASIPTGSVFW